MAPAAPITPAMEARFTAIADAKPPLSNADIQSRLQQSPAVDPKVYYGWLVQHLSAAAARDISGGPITAASMSKVLQDTKYNDPESMGGDLIDSLNAVTGVAALPLGSYTPSGGSLRYCFLQPQLGLLPRDFEASTSRGDAVVTQAKCKPAAPAIPEFFMEIGQLKVATSSATTALDDSNNTGFWLAVAPDRHVFAFWNPLGIDPQFQSLYPPLSGADLSLRSFASPFPGFSAPCAAVQFNLTIDDLLHTDQASRTLTIGTTNFLSLPDKGTIEFGGVDQDGWTRLDRVSPQFAAVPKSSARQGA